MPLFKRTIRTRFESRSTIISELNLPPGVSAAVCGPCISGNEATLDIVGIDGAELGGIISRLVQEGKLVNASQADAHNRNHVRRVNNVTEETG